MRVCTFLRGVNVGGIKLKMADLKADFESAGFTDIVTVLATGNIIFSSDLDKMEIFQRLSEILPVAFFLKTDVEIRQMMLANPFDNERDKHNYVFISDENFAEFIFDSFVKIKHDLTERAALVQGNFYW
ncbi:DUF1697 domain-containing protein [Lactococcus nasutitermitis]|uniref:DUF1697 domain-containing protein n=1 Tax=Lactococcus nasutitermitis TaxID=1652957 RepID=A0ABV9JEU0_9LACT|nr:DUF1697 domain-containing protein [Lactococcus nasutitermitis]